MLLTLPIVLPLVSAAGSLIAWRAPRIQRRIGLISAAALLVVAIMIVLRVDRRGIQTVQLGGWAAPHGITLVADLFTGVMLVMAGVVACAVMCYSAATMDDRHEAFGYYPLVNVLLMGVSGAFLTGDMFNLYVWFEVMLIASFVLIALGGGRAQMEGALKYVAINLVSSSILLAAVGLLYGATGTLNMADLAVKLHEQPSARLVPALSMLFLVSFGVKAAVFPLFFWLPAAYPTPPVAITALFAGLLTKVGVYALFRVFTLIFIRDEHAFTQIVAIAGMTMATGVLGAAAQNESRRILSFHIVSQIGYMIMGLGLRTPYALAGAIFFMVHNILAKTNLFLISGAVSRRAGTYELDGSGGLYASAPGLAVLFMIPAMALAGLPPLPGFLGKLALVRAGLDDGRYVISAVALLTGLLTLYSMTKIWAAAFWRPRPEGPGPSRRADEAAEALLVRLPIVMLAVLTVLLGAAAGPAFGFAMRVAEQLFRPGLYISAVLGRAA